MNNPDRELGIQLETRATLAVIYLSFIETVPLTRLIRMNKGRNEMEVIASPQNEKVTRNITSLGRLPISPSTWNIEMPQNKSNQNTPSVLSTNWRKDSVHV